MIGTAVCFHISRRFPRAQCADCSALHRWQLARHVGPTLNSKQRTHLFSIHTANVISVPREGQSVHAPIPARATSQIHTRRGADGPGMETAVLRCLQRSPLAERSCTPARRRRQLPAWRRSSVVTWCSSCRISCCVSCIWLICCACISSVSRYLRRARGRTLLVARGARRVGEAKAGEKGGARRGGRTFSSGFRARQRGPLAAAASSRARQRRTRGLEVGYSAWRVSVVCQWGRRLAGPGRLPMPLPFFC